MVLPELPAVTATRVEAAGSGQLWGIQRALRRGKSDNIRLLTKKGEKRMLSYYTHSEKIFNSATDQILFPSDLHCNA